MKKKKKKKKKKRHVMRSKIRAVYLKFTLTSQSDGKIRISFVSRSTEANNAKTRRIYFVYGTVTVKFTCINGPRERIPNIAQKRDLVCFPSTNFGLLGRHICKARFLHNRENCTIHLDF